MMPLVCDVTCRNFTSLWCHLFVMSLVVMSPVCNVTCLWCHLSWCHLFVMSLAVMSPVCNAITYWQLDNIHKRQIQPTSPSASMVMPNEKRVKTVPSTCEPIRVQAIESPGMTILFLLMAQDYYYKYQIMKHSLHCHLHIWWQEWVFIL